MTPSCALPVLSLHSRDVFGLMFSKSGLGSIRPCQISWIWLVAVWFVEPNYENINSACIRNPTWTMWSETDLDGLVEMFQIHSAGKHGFRPNGLLHERGRVD